MKIVVLSSPVFLVVSLWGHRGPQTVANTVSAASKGPESMVKQPLDWKDDNPTEPDNNGQDRYGRSGCECRTGTRILVLDRPRNCRGVRAIVLPLFC